MNKKNSLQLLRFSPEEAEHRKLLQGALGYLLPGPKAEEAVDALMERFGGFEGVFLAPEEELEHPGGRPAAGYLRLTTQLAKAYLED